MLLLQKKKIFVVCYNIRIIIRIVVNAAARVFSLCQLINISVCTFSVGNVNEVSDSDDSSEIIPSSQNC